MSLDTYANLKTEITNHLDRDDLANDVDTFIDLAESRHKRDIRIREMINRDAITVDARYESLPTGFLEMRLLRLLTNPVTVLEEVNEFEMTRIRLEGTGKPTRYTVHSQIEFDRTPDSAYSGEIIYYKAETALSDSNTTNNILTRMPEAYLYGALMAAETFLDHDNRVELWARLYREAVDAINALDRKRAGPLFSRVAGATP